VEAELNHAWSSKDSDTLAVEIPETSSIQQTPGIDETRSKEKSVEKDVERLERGSMNTQTSRKKHDQIILSSAYEQEAIDAFECAEEEFTPPDMAQSDDTNNIESSTGLVEETRILSPANAGTSALATPKSSFSIFGTVKDQLQALMNTLRGGSLSRAETHAVEDDLMDVKEVLYGAARRGRERNSEADK